jgi:predicted transcriptional regulator
MPTKKTSKKTYTVNEAAKQLGVTRAAIHQAIKNHKLEWTWGSITQVIERRVKLVNADSLAKYRVDADQQGRGKKRHRACRRRKANLQGGL